MATDAELLVTDGEYAELIRAASRERVLQGRFGPGWVRLLDTPENAWAVRHLKMLRAAEALK